MSDSPICPSLRASLGRLRSFKQSFDISFDTALYSSDPTNIATAQERKLAFMKEAHALQETIAKEHIILREHKKNKEFFGKHYSLDRPPPLPKEATLERINEWKEQGFELHYLPPISMAKIEFDPINKDKILKVTPIDLPGWHKKPDPWLFDQVKNGNFDPSVLDLKDGWILFDTRERPNYDIGNQLYPNDPLAPALEQLRKDKIIQDYKLPGSRFNLSPNELADPAVNQALKEAMHLEDITGMTIEVPSVMAFSVLGNIHYTHLGAANTYEWFQDKNRVGSQRLFGGSSDGGGLSGVRSFDLYYRYVYIGFRLLGRFSSTNADVGVSYEVTL